MKISIVFRHKGVDLKSGKSFDVEMSCIPRLNEYVSFDYIEEDSKLEELYTLLETTRAESFLVTEVNHYCGITTIAPVAALIFVEAVRNETLLKHRFHP